MVNKNGLDGPSAPNKNGLDGPSVANKFEVDGPSAFNKFASDALTRVEVALIAAVEAVVWTERKLGSTSIAGRPCGQVLPSSFLKRITPGVAEKLVIKVYGWWRFWTNKYKESVLYSSSML
ncbi:hypothetical protein BJ742DRAFT_871547 [Cladochytrium replicatum]|nr:hypothetical protein BJ742DRAFT_871547 [Cladochytrium replicatum]